MKRLGPTVITAALAAFVASAVMLAGPRTAAEENQAPKASKTVRQVSSANNRFGFDVFKQIHKAGKNTFISPTSIAVALQMTSQGAKGETLKQMNDTMHVSGLDVGKSNRELLDSLGGHDDVTQKLADSVWVNPKQLTLNSEFAARVEKQFDAQIKSREFNQATLEEINGWVADRTNQKITKLLSKLDPDSAAVLINAIYFHGDWSLKFDKKKTAEADFTLSDGSTRKVQMMSRNDEYRYAESDDAQVIALDYGKKRDMCMWIVLPKQGKSLDELVKSLDADSFKALTDRVWERDGTIRLPRFQMRYKREIHNDLEALGMRQPFHAGADFSGFEGDSRRGGLYISLVIHEAYIDVNEEGTEAAAATAVVMERGAPPSPFSMTCDRPFLFAIQDKASGSITFLGAVHDPLPKKK